MYIMYIGMYGVHSAYSYVRNMIICTSLCVQSNFCMFRSWMEFVACSSLIFACECFYSVLSSNVNTYELRFCYHHHHHRRLSRVSTLFLYLCCIFSTVKHVLLIKCRYFPLSQFVQFPQWTLCCVRHEMCISLFTLVNFMNVLVFSKKSFKICTCLLNAVRIVLFEI